MIIPLFIATSNKSKVLEFSSLLGTKMEQIELDLPELQSMDLLEIVAGKAEAAYQQTGKVCLVDDGGLYFEAWNGLPGAFNRWFIDALGVEKIVEMMEPETNRNATFRHAVGFYDGENLYSTIGEVHGTIAHEVIGDRSFGFDPIFIPDGESQTFGELGLERKNDLSSRRIALDKLSALITSS